MIEIFELYNFHIYGFFCASNVLAIKAELLFFYPQNFIFSGDLGQKCISVTDAIFFIDIKIVEGAILRLKYRRLFPLRRTVMELNGDKAVMIKN